MISMLAQPRDRRDLVALPPEVILCIANYLPTRNANLGLALTNRDLHDKVTNHLLTHHEAPFSQRIDSFEIGLQSRYA